MFDKKVKIRGVIINQIAGVRHSNVVKNAIENETGLEVHGLIPKLNDENLFPSRHLGLITPAEYEHARNSIMVAKELIEDNVDISRIIEIAAEAVEIKVKCEKSIHHNKSNVKIGYFFDRVFSFYYPENLEALKLRGAELIPISSIQDEKLPDIDALYIGGGFPETNIELLLSNKGLMSSVKVACEAGMPVYAECGGLIYLSKALEINSNTYQLAGVFPINIKMGDKPRGHGYIEAVVDSRNPFFHLDSTIRGHEFHYTEIVESSSQLNTCFAMRRGIGAWQNRDGLIYKNTFASYSHIHAITSDSWASSMINRALKFRSKHTK
jgi:cobyrinic acid a,c-diamide synthase